jgi:hypothetical protein
LRWRSPRPRHGKVAWMAVDRSASRRDFCDSGVTISGTSFAWCVLSLLAVSSEACGARSALGLLDANADSGATRAAGGSSGAAGGGVASDGVAGHGGIVTASGGDTTGGRSSGGVRGIVACPSPGSPNEAYDAISGSPCDEPDDFSCRGDDSCSRVCNCVPPPNNECESSAVPAWECDSFARCGRPIACPFDGAVETAYNALSGSPCATKGAACGHCTCELGNGALTWACSLPTCY